MISNNFMDSRMIFEASQHLKSKIIWITVGESEWQYFGAENEVNSEFVIEKVDSYFQDSRFYVSYSRSESFETSASKFIPSISKLIGFQNFMIWDLSFKKAIEFNLIGVLRCGYIQI
jgi:hypothetical protein